MGFSSQWNFGRKIHSWPAPLISVSTIDSWLTKSSCWDRSLAIQQFWLSKGHTGAHLAFKRETSNPRSWRTACKPFCCPDDVVICCGCPRTWGSGFDWGIIVSRCLLSTIRFIHFESFQSIWGQRSMGRWLVENKQGLAVRMGSLKDLNCRS